MLRLTFDLLRAVHNFFFGNTMSVIFNRLIVVRENQLRRLLIFKKLFIPLTHDRQQILDSDNKLYSESMDRIAK